jgi:hypothetical protein
MRPKDIKDLTLSFPKGIMEEESFNMIFDFIHWFAMESQISPSNLHIERDILESGDRIPKKLRLSDYRIGKS